MRFWLAAACVVFAVPAQALPPGPVPQWIWGSRLEHDGQRMSFRRVVAHRGEFKKVELKCLADDRMTVFLNGQEVARVDSARVPTTIDVTAKYRAATKDSVAKNVVALEAENDRGPAGVLVELTLWPPEGRPVSIASDPRWEATDDPEADWKTAEVQQPADAHPAYSRGLIGCPPWYEPIVDTIDYHQWKKALGGEATSAAEVATVSGFQVELLRSSQPGEGSWVSLAFDPKGRLAIGREGPGILRFTLPANGDAGSMEVINDTLQECRGLLYAFDSLYANANNSKGLYRLRDTDADNRFDEVKLLKATPGGVGHGRNDLTLGPDNRIYLICGNDTQLPEDFTPGDSPYRNYADDRLLKCDWDKFLFDRNAKLPAGHVIRTDAEGQTWELFAGGFRNPYGLDFSPEGELFTFDADNEGDIGLPWYRPTRVNHIVSGGEYGWRQGTGIRPAWFPDTLPSTLDIGKASPTSVKFGTRSNFPDRYKKALFILDWSYGRIYAIHLLPRGSSYAATAELVVAGKPLNVTDLEFGPDGAMYFVTGGRGTHSGLYRVRWVGSDSGTIEAPFAVIETAVEADREKILRGTRQGLEEDQVQPLPANVSYLIAVKMGFHDDVWIQQVARVALERQPVDAWSDLVRNPKERRTMVLSLVALARVGTPDAQERLLRDAAAMPLEALSRELRLAAIRAVAISLARHGRPDEATLDVLRKHFEGLYPFDCHPLNQLTCELLAYLESPQVVAKTMPLLETASTQEETLCWLFLLRNVKSGWTPEHRRTFFRYLQKANAYEGGRDMTTTLVSIRFEALANAPTDERAALVAEFSFKSLAAAEPTGPVRPKVKEWKIDDLTALFPSDRKGDAQRGKTLFSEARCLRCHRVRGEGVPVGPDLVGASLRLSRRDLLVSILEPSLALDDKYRNVTLALHSGKTVSGRIMTGDAERLLVSPNPLEPDSLEIVPVAEIESQTPSNISPMPADLLNTLAAEEILDLLTYIDSLATR